MQNLERVPCTQVTSSNWLECWPLIDRSLRSAFFVGIDFEFSGIGDRSHNQQRDLTLRYKTLRETARTRSVISIGLSVFEALDEKQVSTLAAAGQFRRKAPTAEELEEGELDPEEQENWFYRVRNFNIFCECDGEYVREAQAFEFLTSHGFNLELFNSDAIRYPQGNDVPSTDGRPCVRQIFSLLVQQKVPIVLHNGFLDLFFLYQHFYAELPDDVQVLLADLDDMFPAGVFDTKYICEKETDLPISYLTRIFYEIQRINIHKITLGDKYLLVDFEEEERHQTYANLKTNILQTYPKDLQICANYEFKGWCPNHNGCPRSHNIDFILDTKSIQSQRDLVRLKRMRDVNRDRRPKTSSPAEAEPNLQSLLEQQNQHDQRNLHAKQGTHSAGFDAFMTAYCFASFLVELCKERRPCAQFDPKLLGILNIKNQLHLHGNLNRRVTIAKTPLTPYSSGHQTKIAELRPTTDSE